LIEIRTEDFNAFFDAPFACYGRDTHFVTPMKSDLKRSLDAKKNPLYRHFARRTWFTAHRDGKIVGRILAQVHDASNQLHGLKRASFGLFDCIDDQQVAAALLGAAADWGRQQGCTELAGSFNLTITQMIGVVTEGHDHPAYTYQDWSPPHIARLIEACGFEPFFPMRTYELDVTTLDPERLLDGKARNLVGDPDFEVRPIRRRDLTARLLEANAVLNDSFAKNAMFVPLTEEEFIFPCAGMTLIIDEELSWVAYRRGEPVGVLLCIPDLNPFLKATDFRIKWSTPWLLWRFRKRQTRASVIFFAVKQQWHGLGINPLLLHRCVSAMKRKGFATLGISWVSDGNQASQRQMQKLGAKPLHRLHLFRKAI
jgi:GNAT superfamily N-acetyltransferase